MAWLSLPGISSPSQLDSAGSRSHVQTIHLSLLRGMTYIFDLVCHPCGIFGVFENSPDSLFTRAHILKIVLCIFLFIFHLLDLVFYLFFHLYSFKESLKIVDFALNPMVHLRKWVLYIRNQMVHWFFEFSVPDITEDHLIIFFLNVVCKIYLLVFIKQVHILFLAIDRPHFNCLHL